MEITCLNGNSMIFMGLDDVEKLKSIVGITGVWIEEASELTREDFMQLDLRLRGRTAQYKQIILTFNPISVLNWLKKHFFDVPKEITTVLRTTYKDNRFIDPEYAQVIEDLKDQDYVYYQVYALGEWGILGNLIFTNYVVEPIPTDDAAYKTVYSGLDFGFNNPSVFLKVGERDRELYVYSELYERKLTTQS